MSNYSFAGRYRELRKAIVPQDSETNAFLYDVDCQTKRDVEEKFGCIINYDWHCNTIANCTVDSIIKAMGVDLVDCNTRRTFLILFETFAVNKS